MSLLRRFTDFMGLTDPLKGRELTAVYVATPAGPVKIWPPTSPARQPFDTYIGYCGRGCDDAGCGK